MGSRDVRPWAPRPSQSTLAADGRAKKGQNTKHRYSYEQHEQRTLDKTLAALSAFRTPALPLRHLFPIGDIAEPRPCSTGLSLLGGWAHRSICRVKVPSGKAADDSEKAQGSLPLVPACTWRAHSL
jgi:hypothetical protein